MTTGSGRCALEKKIPGPVMLDRLAVFYDVSIDYLIRGTKDEQARALSRPAPGVLELVPVLEKLTPEQLAAVRPTIEALARANEPRAPA